MPRERNQTLVDHVNAQMAKPVEVAVPGSRSITFNAWMIEPIKPPKAVIFATMGWGGNKQELLQLGLYGLTEAGLAVGICEHPRLSRSVPKIDGFAAPQIMMGENILAAADKLGIRQRIDTINFSMGFPGDLAARWMEPQRFGNILSAAPAGITERQSRIYQLLPTPIRPTAAFLMLAKGMIETGQKAKKIEVTPEAQEDINIAAAGCADYVKANRWLAFKEAFTVPHADTLAILSEVRQRDGIKAAFTLNRDDLVVPTDPVLRRLFNQPNLVDVVNISPGPHHQMVLDSDGYMRLTALVLDYLRTADSGEFNKGFIVLDPQDQLKGHKFNSLLESRKRQLTR